MLDRISPAKAPKLPAIVWLVCISSQTPPRLGIVAIAGATGTNRYFYVDDVNVAYPAGVAIDLGNLDLWAEGLPVAPAIATMPSLGGVWDEPLSAHTIAGSFGALAGEKIGRAHV